MGTPARTTLAAPHESRLVPKPPDPLLDGIWWPNSPDLVTELQHLVSALDHIRGPVTRLLVAIGDGTVRPHQFSLDSRTITIGYRTCRPSTVITVICADGGAFSAVLAPPGPAPVSPATAWTTATPKPGHRSPGPLRSKTIR